MAVNKPDSDALSATNLGYLNGQWRAAEQLQVSIADLGFVQAVTAVERLRSYAGQLFERQTHLERFRQSAAVLQLNLAGIDLDRLLDELLQRNAAWLAAAGEFGLTLFATPGSGPPSPANLGMVCSRLDLPQIRQRQQFGQPIVVSDVQQPPPQCWPRQIKVRCRLHYYLADRAAAAYCPGALGVLLDQDGTLTETSVANLAIVRDGAIVSPPPERVLPGITQRVVEAYARREQIPWRHEPLPPECLRDAEEILLFGTTTGVWNGRLVDAPVAGHWPMSAELRKALP
ncbi:aminotransferase class IV [Roseimaritima ulvae]|uniref:D-alanine aminotransferase n=1 Tax=Roseimaritima ulvae TaxID=980254 RepID=A0A5B9QN00_9BACT|nr:aminotransferase class IV [Roseimaritima ulvae]QEG40334.1 D-alanine aminotransferase [Roseimaritima ulvae]